MVKLSSIIKARKANALAKKNGKIKKKDADKSIRQKHSKKEGKDEALKRDVEKFIQNVNSEDTPSEDDSMSMDAFLEGGFEELDSANSNDAGSSRKRKNLPNENTQDSTSESSEEEEDGLESYQKQLEGLKEKDPEFYKFLEQNDQDLLEFNAAETDAMAKEIDENERLKSSSGKIVLTSDTIQQWQKLLETNHSLTTLQKVVQAFKAAAFLNEEEAEDLKYTISDSKVFNDLLLLAIQYVPKVLNYHVPIQEDAKGKKFINTDSKVLPKLRPVLKSYGFSILRLLEGMTDAKNISLLLREVQNVLPYMITYRKFLKQFTQATVEVWSSTRDDSVRFSAVVLLRTLCLTADITLLEFVLKEVYLGMARQSAYTTVHTLDKINFLKNSAVNLFLLDAESCYLIGFRYIRQLAITLRNTIHQPSKDSRKPVQSWSYVHSLDFWARLLSQAAWLSREKGVASELQSLVYPLVQIALGVIMSSPSSQLFPMRFHIIRSLIYLSRHTGVFIPLVPSLFEVLDSSYVSRKAKASTLKPLDFDVELRASSSYLRTKVYQDGLIDQLLELLSEYYVLYATDISFPELVIPAIVRSKRFAKRSKNAKLNRGLLTLVNRLEQQSKFMTEKRNQQKFAPIDSDSVEQFAQTIDWQQTPLGIYVVTQRQTREEQRKLIRESVQQDQEHKEQMRQKKKQALKSDDIELNDLSEEEAEDIDE